MVPPCQLTPKDQDPSLRRTKCSGSKSQPAAVGRPPAIPKCTAAALWLLTSQQKQALDRVRRVVNGDGHCQFNAAAAGLGPGHDYAAMRASAILFMVQNPDMLLMTASLQLRFVPFCVSWPAHYNWEVSRVAVVAAYWSRLKRICWIRLVAANTAGENDDEVEVETLSLLGRLYSRIRLCS